MRKEISAILGALGVTILLPSVALAGDAASPTIATTSLSAEAADLIDLVAADFFEHSLAATQAAAIEDLTAAHYRALPERDRKAFLRERAASWRTMPSGTRERTKNAARPRFENLTEEQKAPFRAHARRFLFDTDDAAPNRREI